MVLIFSNEVNELFTIISFVGYYVSVFVTANSTPKCNTLTNDFVKEDLLW